MGVLDRLMGREAQTRLFPAEMAAELERARNGLAALTSAHDGLFRIGSAAWSVDQNEGTIVFDAPDGLRAVAPVQIIGTYDTLSQTWLWGWDHPSVQPPLAEHAKRMRAYGEERGLETLVTRKLACTEQDCWDMAALTCSVCGAQGAYRGPAGPTLVFFTFGPVTLSRGD